MALRLFNTLTREKEDFVPINPPDVGYYACGPTVYGYAHVGNLRTYVFEDILHRVLAYNGYNVKHVMNITDVGHLTSDEDEGEDKMEVGARREGKSPQEIAQRYTDAFFEDFDSLNLLRPDVICKATDHIDEMIALVECLIDNGVGYEIGDGVYFDVAKFPDYGKLSRLSLEGQEAGSRVEINPEKHGPFDFALWKRAERRHLQQWTSPWGQGYPGWHIECSAMSMKYLGETFDIHTGGIDHIPVHHENEIAQSEACTHKKFVNYWLHGEFLNMSGTKISKSKGGTLRVKDLADQGFSPMAYRYFTFGAHYRSTLNFGVEALESASTTLNNLYDFISRAASEPGSAAAATRAADEVTERDEAWLDDFKNQFLDSINDDLNMPKAIATVWELIREANRRGNTAAALPLLFDWDSVLGLNLREHAEREDSLTPEQQALVDERQTARQERNWKRSDEIRAQLREHGIEVEDTPNGPRWKRI